jgi:hypothetical protein
MEAMLDLQNANDPMMSVIGVDFLCEIAAPSVAASEFALLEMAGELSHEHWVQKRSKRSDSLIF